MKFSGRVRKNIKSSPVEILDKTFDSMYESCRDCEHQGWTYQVLICFYVIVKLFFCLLVLFLQFSFVSSVCVFCYQALHGICNALSFTCIIRSWQPSFSSFVTKQQNPKLFSKEILHHLNFFNTPQHVTNMSQTRHKILWGQFIGIQHVTHVTNIVYINKVIYFIYIKTLWRVWRVEIL